MRPPKIAGLVSALHFLSISVSTLAQEGDGGLKKENLDLPYDVRLEPEEKEDAPEILVFYGQVYEADAFVFVFPIHWGMWDPGYVQLDVVKREIKKAISEFSSQVELGVIAVDGEVQEYPLSGQAVRATEYAKKEAVDFVMRQQPRQDWVCLLDGLLSALDMAKTAAARHKAVMYVGDGITACRKTGTVDTDLVPVLRTVTAANSDRVRIHCVKTWHPTEETYEGTGVAEGFLRQLAELNNGTYRRAYH